MSYIPLNNDFPGIIGLLETYDETGKILRSLADTLLNKNTHAFNKAERETVASYISFLNNCKFCYKSHSSVADCLWNTKGKTLALINECEKNDDKGEKMIILLRIAKKLHESPQGVKQEDIDSLKTFEFTSNDINELILIISSFCMFNRYVDGLGTSNSLNDEMYSAMGEKIANNGYI
jgi:uncharacterized peroxidase-related enzyme